MKWTCNRSLAPYSSYFNGGNNKGGKHPEDKPVNDTSDQKKKKISSRILNLFLESKSTESPSITPACFLLAPLYSVRNSIWWGKRRREPNQGMSLKGQGWGNVLIFNLSGEDSVGLLPPLYNSSFRSTLLRHFH